MAAELRLEKYVQRKVRAGREFFYFRVVRAGREIRMPLPHPFAAEYRAAYDAAHRSVFGATPGESESPTCIAAMTRQHRESEKYKKLPPASKTLRNLALDLMDERWGEFEAAAIIARQSGWDARVNLDEILRRGVWDGIRVIAAGKLCFGC